MRQPTESQRSEIERTLVADLQRTARSWPIIAVLAETPDRERPERNRVESGQLDEDYQGIRNHTGGKKYEHGDPTADRAFSFESKWLDTFERLQGDLEWLARTAAKMVPDRLIVCFYCSLPILDEENARRSGNKPAHECCRIADTRGKVCTNHGTGDASL